MVATPYEIVHGDVWNVGLDGSARPGRHVCDGSGRLALAFDREADVPLKHGEASAVRAWAARQAAAIDPPDVVDFPPTPETVALLNGCVHGLGGPTHLLAGLVALGEARPELAAIPTYPA